MLKKERLDAIDTVTYQTARERIGGQLGASKPPQRARLMGWLLEGTLNLIG